MLAASALLLAAALHAAEAKRVLVVTATKGFRHSSIPIAEAVLDGLAKRTGDFTVDYARGGKDGKDDTDVREKMSKEALKNYDAIIFANTTGDLAVPDPQAFIDWVKSGKGFVGMHSASDTFHGFRPFIDMLGGEFLVHHEQAGVECLNHSPNHPSTKPLGTSYTVFDEIYLMKSFQSNGVHRLLNLDKHPNTKAPGDYPIAWCKTVGKGKVFYTSLGHREDVWTSDKYQDHILGGIRWALGLEKGDSEPQDYSYKISDEERKQGFKALFNGKDLSGWKLRNPNGAKSWSVQNGMLVNTASKDVHGTDLISEEKFRDFTVRYEYQVPKGSNSGFYLRGRYEIQILDDFEGNKPGMGGNGAIYNTKPVSMFASRRPGEWQEVEATIQGNRITVYLNGVKVHDNVEVTKATGSQLDDNLDQPGPVFLQGDHGAVAFRNIRVKALK